MCGVAHPFRSGFSLSPSLTFQVSFLLSCKPQMAKTLLTEAGMAEALEDKLVISILAGATIAQLTESVPTSCRVVRAMPNTPTRVSRSQS